VQFTDSARSNQNLLRNGYKRRSIIGAMAKLVILTWILLLSSSAHAASDPVFSKQLTDTIAQVRSAESVDARTDAAEHLAEMTRGANSKKVDDRTIAEIASLLNTQEDSVRAGVAACLGNFGSRARFTAPKLEAILAEVDCLPFDLTSAASIRPTLRKMGIKPPERKCP
jgi:hypothetical protein